MLVATRRRVPANLALTYAEEWHSIATAAVGAGARAWRFHSASEAGLYIEFLEFRAGADPRPVAEVAAGLARLEAIAAGETEEWTNAGSDPKGT